MLTDEETPSSSSGIPLKPGYSVRTYKDRVYLVPRVLEVGEVLSLGPVLQPNLKQALEMPGGVSVSNSF